MYKKINIIVKQEYIKTQADQFHKLQTATSRHFISEAQLEKSATAKDSKTDNFLN